MTLYKSTYLHSCVHFKDSGGIKYNITVITIMNLSILYAENTMIVTGLSLRNISVMQGFIPQKYWLVVEVGTAVSRTVSPLYHNLH